MTNDEGNPNDRMEIRPRDDVSCSVWSFVLRTLFRHSSFGASSFPLGVRRFRIQLRFWREIVVDDDRDSVAQLKHSGAHDLLTVFKSFRDRNEIAPGLSHAHELLP